jgi:Domain of unknown function (DUF4382)
MSYKTIFGGIIPLLCLLFIAGCSSSSTSPARQGEFRLLLVDSPAGYDQVNIVVTKVEVHAVGSDSASGWITLTDTTVTYDLLKLVNGANSIIGDKMLPVGKYTQIRLSIGTGSNIVIDGVSYGLEVSSATGLKLNHNFDIEEGKLYLLTLDCDAAKSITLINGNQYKLHPVIRVVANVISGSISGIINPVAVRATISTTVAGSDTVSTVSDATNGSFKLVALPAGTYDVIITPNDSNYLDTTITGIQVVAQQDKNMGTIILTTKP